MRRSGSSALWTMVLALAVLGGAIGGQAAETRRIRGTIEQVHGSALTIATREGPTVELTLAPDARIAALVPAELSSAGTGSFIGTAAVPQADGTLEAQEILIFPEAMRGVGEGHRPWDLTPDSTMTNATVAEVAEAAKGRLLKLRYKDGEKELEVPMDAPIVTIAPGDPSLLRPGTAVFISATKAADGSLAADRVIAGKDGVPPPM